MSAVESLVITISDSPVSCRYIGNPELLKLPLQPLICSRKTPADKILPTLEQVWHWRDTGQAVISGFHSPLEKECLKALLRGNSPIVICPARSIEKLRIPREWRSHLSKGLLLVFSPFINPRVDAKTARERNGMIIYLADTAPSHCQCS
jgi:hypothetical protein